MPGPRWKDSGVGSTNSAPLQSATLFEIWVPAFAGMSGVRERSAPLNLLAHLQRPERPEVLDLVADVLAHPVGGQVGVAGDDRLGELAVVVDDLMLELAPLGAGQHLLGDDEADRPQGQ